jgi:hypothetical protein
MIGMNTFLQSYSHVEPLTKLELVIPHFSLCMDYFHYCLHNTGYHPNMVKIEIHDLLES